MQNYELPEHHSGDTYEGVSFEMLRNESPLVVTGASIAFEFREAEGSTSTVVQTLTTGAAEVTITDGDAGKFKINKQIIDWIPCHYYYDMVITFADSTVKTYVVGRWRMM